jgi:hypothetical protein
MVVHLAAKRFQVERPSPRRVRGKGGFNHGYRIGTEERFNADMESFVHANLFSILA